jgi:hypothetical protein
MVLTLATSVAADSPTLKGNYAITGTAACIVSNPGAPGTGGFNPNLTPVAGSNVFSNSFSAVGIQTFNGDGTGTVTATNVTITLPQTPGFPGSAGSTRGTASFTYTVDNDGTFTVQFTSFGGTVLTGPSAGQTFTSDLPPLVGLIGDNGTTLTLASVEPTVETFTPQIGTASPRICHRSRVLVKIGKDKGKD